MSKPDNDTKAEAVLNGLRRDTTKTLADRYFAAWYEKSSAEDDLINTFLAALGVDPDEPEKWPCGDFGFDHYDNSFELLGTRNDYLPSAEQLVAALNATGLSHGWINYVDGTEIHCDSKGARGPRREGHRKGESDEYRRLRGEIGRLKQRIAELEDALNPADVPVVK